MARGTSDAAWATFEQASAVWGFPAGCRSATTADFNGRMRGARSSSRTNLRVIGVRPRQLRHLFHPQTCGKVERFQQTLKKWLRNGGPRRDLAQLQAQLDAWVDTTTITDPHRSLKKCSTRRHLGSHPACETGRSPDHGDHHHPPRTSAPATPALSVSALTQSDSAGDTPNNWSPSSPQETTAPCSSTDTASAN